MSISLFRRLSEKFVHFFCDTAANVLAGSEKRSAYNPSILLIIFRFVLPFQELFINSGENLDMKLVAGLPKTVQQHTWLIVFRYFRKVFADIGIDPSESRSAKRIHIHGSYNKGVFRIYENMVLTTCSFVPCRPCSLAIGFDHFY